MKLVNCPILRNECVAPDVYQLTIHCAAARDTRCGQFADIAVVGKPLRRPLSITDWTEDTLVFTYKVVGGGTDWLAKQQTGCLDVLTGCGNGFDLDAFTGEVLLIGGGIGCAPMVGTAREALRRGLKVRMILGFPREEDKLFEKELSALDVEAHYCYDSQGENVVTAMQRLGWTDLPFCACGPTRMLRAVCDASSAAGQVSLEARMGCGFGACMGCSIELKDRMARVCKEGPVFDRKEIVWENLV